MMQSQLQQIGNTSNGDHDSSGALPPLNQGGEFNFNMFSSNKVQVDEDFLKEKLDLIKADVLEELNQTKSRLEYYLQEKIAL